MRTKIYKKEITAKNAKTVNHWVATGIWKNFDPFNAPPEGFKEAWEEVEKLKAQLEREETWLEKAQSNLQYYLDIEEKSFQQCIVDGKPKDVEALKQQNQMLDSHMMNVEVAQSRLSDTQKQLEKAYDVKFGWAKYLEEQVMVKQSKIREG